MKREIKNKELLLLLVRLGIGKSIGSGVETGVQCALSKDVDWEGVKKLAGQQGLSAIAFDGVMKLLKEGVVIPRIVKNQWLSNVLYMFEKRYSNYEAAISSLAGFYNAHGYKMMLLKGYGLSLNYPVPNHRPCGDIDIWLFGSYKEADAALAREMSVKIDNSHHHHTVFDWKGFMVENHYDFLNVHHHVSNKKVEEIFKGADFSESSSYMVNGEKVYLPSPTFHALFLLRHSLAHFAAIEITLRHLLDWGFFVEKHSKEIDWKWLIGVMDEFKMREFCALMNAICVEDLGFEKEIFPSIPIDLEENEFKLLKERVLNDIIEPEFGGDEPSLLLPRLLFKFRRWRANGWKHKLCYRESMFSGFVYGIWNHILKPSSF